MKRSEIIATIANLLGNMDSADEQYVRLPFHATNGLTMVVRMAVQHDKASRDQMNLFPELETSWTSGGKLTGIAVGSGGAAYTVAPSVIIGAPTQPGGVQAIAVATVVLGVVTAITLTEPGYGYTAAPAISFSGGGGSGATATASISNTGTTQNGVATMPLPADKIAVYDVASYDDPTIGVTMLLNRVEPMAKTPVRRIAAQEKTETGFPRRYAFKDNQVIIHPVPSSTPDNYLTFLEFFGWRKDRDFTIVTDDVEPLIDRAWHNAACQLGAYLAAVEMGWGSDAQAFYDAGEKMISQAIDTAALTQQDDAPRVMLDGWFGNRREVYRG